jgi:hypothetical protein
VAALLVAQMLSVLRSPALRRFAAENHESL